MTPSNSVFSLLVARIVGHDNDNDSILTTTTKIPRNISSGSTSMWEKISYYDLRNLEQVLPCLPENFTLSNRQVSRLGRLQEYHEITKTSLLQKVQN